MRHGAAAVSAVVTVVVTAAVTAAVIAAVGFVASPVPRARASHAVVVSCSCSYSSQVESVVAGKIADALVVELVKLMLQT